MKTNSITLTLTDVQVAKINSLNSERSLEEQVMSIFSHGLRDTLYRRDRQRKVNQQLKEDSVVLDTLRREHPELFVK